MELRGKDSSSEIHVSDVLCWAVSETWIEIRRSIPLWAVQGRRFERQHKIWCDVHNRKSGALISSHAKEFLEPECQSLEQRYSPGAGDSMTICETSDVNENLEMIEKRCREFDNPNLASATLQ
ncbi:uncharacterized protein LDX57_002118 [Aspergillus melleus]|uniref:uncharacterized protein n=1 Tax=Aspergillus melleus TaxID=138277 RepID=UPI001E8CD1B4|nr:uncharacterized protein LDX57_002118 [Aspergillus melleus]KAH8424367.1 hypothetical protein LDX57_002118 [Aspergillus melleus]